MSQRESRLSKTILQALRQKGIFCWKNHGSEYMMAGLPDIIACVRGRFVAMEVKLPETRNNVSARQRYVIGEIQRSKGTAEVVCSVKEAIDLCMNVSLAQEIEDARDA